MDSARSHRDPHQTKCIVFSHARTQLWRSLSKVVESGNPALPNPLPAVPKMRPSPDLVQTKIFHGEAITGRYFKSGARSAPPAFFLTFLKEFQTDFFSEATMALEIIVRRRRNATPPPGTDVREKSDPPEDKIKEESPANDNEGAWPFIPFPDGW